MTEVVELHSALTRQGVLLSGGRRRGRTGNSPAGGRDNVSEALSARTITQSNSVTRAVRASRLTGNMPLISNPALS